MARPIRIQKGYRIGTGNSARQCRKGFVMLSSTLVFLTLAILQTLIALEVLAKTAARMVIVIIGYLPLSYLTTLMLHSRVVRRKN